MANGLEKRQELLARAKELGIEGYGKLKNAELEAKIAEAEGTAAGYPEENQVADAENEGMGASHQVVDTPEHVEIVEEVEPPRYQRAFGQQAVLYTDEASQAFRDEDDNPLHPLDRSYGIPELRSKKRDEEDE